MPAIDAQANNAPAGNTVTLCTPPHRGAIAIVQLAGPDTISTLAALTGRTDWHLGQPHHVKLPGIDDMVAILLRDRPTPTAQLMPHGGPRIVSRLLEKLTRDHHVTITTHIPGTAGAADLYPEAASPIEADMLAAIASAASPCAIDALALQPERWCAAVTSGMENANANVQPVAQHDPRDHWLSPPTVVIAGQANVGKSTLINAWSGRSASIVANQPGTTRDYVGSRVTLASVGLVVDVIDTPGWRDDADAIEKRATKLARNVIASADVLVAMRDPQIDWPGDDSLWRPADVKIINKIDLATGMATRDDALRISAANATGLDALELAIAKHLGLADPESLPPCWAFSNTLKRWAGGEPIGLRTYVGL